MKFTIKTIIILYHYVFGNFEVILAFKITKIQELLGNLRFIIPRGYSVSKPSTYPFLTNAFYKCKGVLKPYQIIKLLVNTEEIANSYGDNKHEY